jgi:hypothetical protein
VFAFGLLDAGDVFPAAGIDLNRVTFFDECWNGNL